MTGTTAKNTEHGYEEWRGIYALLRRFFIRIKRKTIAIYQELNSLKSSSKCNNIHYPSFDINFTLANDYYIYAKLEASQESLSTLDLRDDVVYIKKARSLDETENKKWLSFNKRNSVTEKELDEWKTEFNAYLPDDEEERPETFADEPLTKTNANAKPESTVSFCIMYFE